MEDLLIEILETFGFPVRRQGSLLPDEPYPDDFFTFWNRSSDPTGYFDDDYTGILYTYDVNFYSNDAEKVYEISRKALEKLKNAGFEVIDTGHDVASDNDTHTGRGFIVCFVEN